MNTHLEYLYRDAGNYKRFNDVVVAGVVKKGDIERYLYEHQFFIPSEVGLPDLQPEVLTLDDHIWHEIVGLEETADEPTVEMGAVQLIKGFKKAYAADWNQFEVMERKGLC